MTSKHEDGGSLTRRVLLPSAEVCKLLLSAPSARRWVGGWAMREAPTLHTEEPPAKGRTNVVHGSVDARCQRLVIMLHELEVGWAARRSPPRLRARRKVVDFHGAEVLLLPFQLPFGICKEWSAGVAQHEEEINEEALVAVATDKLPVVAREHLRTVNGRPERTRCHQMTKRFLWRPDQIKALARVKDAPLNHTQPALEDVQARLQEHHARVNWCVLVGARCHVGA